VAVRRAIRSICPCTNNFCTKDLTTGYHCPRLTLLERARKLKKITLRDVYRKLDEVNLGDITLQSMVFEPAALKLHIALGDCPVTKHPYHEVDLGPLLKMGRR
jgi:hypothetical protein